MCPSADVIMELAECDGHSPIVIRSAWWRHQMETFSALLALLQGNRAVTGGFPLQRPVTRSIDICCDLPLNKRLSKQRRRWWFETPLLSIWRYCNEWQARFTQSWVAQKQDVPAILTNPHRPCTTPLNIRNDSLVIDLIPINISIPAVEIHVFFKVPLTIQWFRIRLYDSYNITCNSELLIKSREIPSYF